MIDYKSSAPPRAKTPDGCAIYCSFDKIVPIRELKPNPANPNTHGDSQIKLLGDIIESTGWRAPITVSKRSGLIVKGHGRRMAAIHKGLQYAPVEFRDYATDAEERKEGDLVVDFFGGSGSTLLAAEMENRRCYCTELDPKYCDLIIKRYTDATGDDTPWAERDGKKVTLKEALEPEGGRTKEK